jgi:cytochrome c oxidase cbb3-type subunit 3
VSKDTNRILGHADEADGIEEYDNPLPDWWVGLFWLTIVWAVAYGIHYHFIADRSHEKRLAAEIAAAESRWPEQSGAQVAFAIDPQSVEGGQTVFAQNCSACHGAELEGGIGPTFLDDEWLHGGTATEVLRTIRDGVLDKGMVAWKGILSPEQINHVAAYVLSRHAEATGRALSDILGEPGTPGDDDATLEEDVGATATPLPGAGG